MDDQKRFKEFERKESDRKALATELEAKIPELSAQAEALEAEARRLRVLDEPGWKSAQAEAERKRAEAEKARTEALRAREDLAVIAGEKAKLQNAIRSEILRTYRGFYAVELKGFSDKLKAAVDALEKLREVQSQADRECSAVGIGAVSLTPAGRGNVEFALEPEQIWEFRKVAAANGYEL